MWFFPHLPPSHRDPIIVIIRQACNNSYVSFTLTYVLCLKYFGWRCPRPQKAPFYPRRTSISAGMEFSYIQYRLVWTKFNELFLFTFKTNQVTTHVRFIIAIDDRTITIKQHST